MMKHGLTLKSVWRKQFDGDRVSGFVQTRNLKRSRSTTSPKYSMSGYSFSLFKNP